MAATLGGGAAPAAGEGGRDTTPVGATGEPRRALRGPRRGRARRREPSARRPPHQAAKRAPRGGCYRRRGGRQRILARRSLPRGSGKVYKRPRRRRGVGAATAIEGGGRGKWAGGGAWEGREVRAGKGSRRGRTVATDRCARCSRSVQQLGE